MFNYKYKNNQIVWDYSMGDTNSKSDSSYSENSKQTQINAISIPKGFMPLLPYTFGQPINLYRRLGVSRDDYKSILRIAFPDVEPEMLTILEV
jgi:hypothetical protein